MKGENSRFTRREFVIIGGAAVMGARFLPCTVKAQPIVKEGATGERGLPGGTTREELLETAYKLGFKYERMYKGCAQCAIAAIHDTLGIRDESIFKSATGLAGGGGLTGLGDCGAYIGGSMVLSQLCGRERSNFADHEEIRKRSFWLTSLLIDKFTWEFGAINCRGVQTKIFGRSYDIRMEWDAFEAAGAHVDKCTNVVGKGAQVAVQIILDQDLVKI